MPGHGTGFQGTHAWGIIGVLQRPEDWTDGYRPLALEDECRGRAEGT